MKKILLLIIPLFIFSCGDDSLPDPNSGQNSSSTEDDKGSTMSGSNENPSLSRFTGKLWTETTTTTAQKEQALAGMEMPRLTQADTCAFIVHTIPTYGINYCMEYNINKKSSLWTAYKWYSGFSSQNYNWNRNNWKSGQTYNGYGGNGDPFQPDPVIPENYRSSLMFYSGYQRGHMLGSADRLNSKEANGQTFYMSNMHPQLGGLNESPGIWYNLEIWLRDKYDKASFRDTLYVVKGGTIDNTKSTIITMQGEKVYVPKYYYMAVMVYDHNYASNTWGGYAAIGFWMEHKAITGSDFLSHAVSIDELERLTGIDFFCNLPDKIENAMEQTFASSYWGLK